MKHVALRLALSVAIFMCAVVIGASGQVLVAGASDPLFEAIRRDDTPVVAALLARGADANARDREGATALMHAAFYARPEVVKALLAHDPDVNASSEVGATALMRSVANAATVTLLLDRGANVHAKAKSGTTALILAAGYAGAAASVKVLLDKGADPNANDLAGTTPLMRAADLGDVEIMKLLLAKGAEADRKRNNEVTALVWAAESRNPDAVRLLLDQGAKLNAMQGRPGAPLPRAVRAGETAIVDLLLTRGATMGPDILLMATRREGIREAALVRLLLARGADVNATDEEGRTPLSEARRHGETVVATLLKDAGARASNTADGRERAAVRPMPAHAGGPGAVRRALDRTLPLLQKSGPLWMATSKGCVSCHHQALPGMAVGLARERGLAVDDAVAREQSGLTLAQFAERREPMREGKDAFPNMPLNGSYALLGLAADGRPADATTDAMVHALLGMQRTDGRWRTITSRPPTNSDIAATALTLRVVRLFAPKGRGEEVALRVRRAAAWLAAATPETTSEWTHRLLGLRWADGHTEAIGASAAALRAQQRADGGWAQLPTLDSDAYATGQVLVALHQAGGIAVTDPVYRRGIEFLLKTQLEDGSWFVQTRAYPIQSYFESGFPHGASQFISCAGTSWAAMALTLTIEPPALSR